MNHYKLCCLDIQTYLLKGTLVGFKARMYVNPAARPKFCQARSVPYALRSKVEAEIARLLEEGTIEPVEWADTNCSSA